MVEAAMMNIPVVYFRGSGGADEFIATEAGFPLPYLNTDAACSTICKLADDAQQREATAEIARTKYERLHTEKAVLPYVNNIFNP